MVRPSGGSIRSCLLFSVLMLAAVVMTVVMAVWVIVIGAGAHALATNDQSDNPLAFSAPLQAGDRPAPGFTLTDLDGNHVSLSRFRGQPVVINFWATWCPPCRAEVPHLIQAYEREQGKVVFLAVSIDETDGTVRRFAEENGMPFTILLDDGGKVASDYRVLGIPATFFVSRDGAIVARYEGQLSPDRIEEGLSRIR